tara:strand:- start:320 stop:1102 length:783 start_codon:yes stop_codon:yes gene_type:complete
MELTLKKVSIIKIIVLIVIIYFTLRYIYLSYEGFDRNNRKPGKTINCVNDYLDYNKNVYSFESKITLFENDFILKWIKKLDHDDTYKYPYISTFTVGYTIHNNTNHVNKSRFGIGTITKNKEFKSDCINLFKKMNIDINSIKSDYGYDWYGIAWDIEDALLKLYLLNNRKTEIICYVYNVDRKNDNIISRFVNVKKYKITEDYTTMFKDGKEIIQYNTSKLPTKLIKKYDVDNKIKEIKNTHLILDSYSEYDNKLNLYFD